LSIAKTIFISALGLFVLIGGAAAGKKILYKKPQAKALAQTSEPKSNLLPVDNRPKAPSSKVVIVPASASSQPLEDKGDFPSIDRVHQFFTTGPTKFPIVETIVYDSRVPWLKGRPAWIADYAAYYATSRHFIARSLNGAGGKPDYFSQKVSTGSRFNVFRKDRNFQFYLLVDLSLCKMGFYYIDLDTNERVLVKTYKVGLGRLAGDLSLTAAGRYLLGGKVAVYKPGVMGQFQDRQIEMVRVFGTRWLPFEPVAGEAVSGKRLGIHGAPLEKDEKTGQYVEMKDVVGRYESDGCIRLLFEDVEELFSIVITRPTIVEVVKHFKDATLPGIEVSAPKRDK